MAGQSIAGVNVIANSKDAPMYVCQQWIDEVLIVVPDDKPYPDELIKKLEETGVTMHLRLSKIAAVEDRPQFCGKDWFLHSAYNQFKLCITKQLYLSV